MRTASLFCSAPEGDEGPGSYHGSHESAVFARKFGKGTVTVQQWQAVMHACRE